ncbi:MAG: CoxE, partial [Solirubrobacterales bacterium]
MAAAGQPRGAIAPTLVDFCRELRDEGLRVGTSELLDAFAALNEVDWSRRENFREALATTVAKSQE